MADGWALLRVDDGPPGDWTQDGISLVVDGLVLVNLSVYILGYNATSPVPERGCSLPYILSSLRFILVAFPSTF